MKKFLLALALLTAPVSAQESTDRAPATQRICIQGDSVLLGGALLPLPDIEALLQSYLEQNPVVLARIEPLYQEGPCDPSVYLSCTSAVLLPSGLCGPGYTGQEFNTWERQEWSPWLERYRCQTITDVYCIIGDFGESLARRTVSSWHFC